jgi:hypothetical protein
MLQAGTPLAPGSAEEVSVRAASIIAVERVREVMIQTREKGGRKADEVSSVLIDFYLWDLAKGVETGNQTIEGIDTVDMVPAHRTRSIWY